MSTPTSQAPPRRPTGPRASTQRAQAPGTVQTEIVSARDEGGDEVGEAAPDLVGGRADLEAQTGEEQADERVGLVDQLPALGCSTDSLGQHALGLGQVPAWVSAEPSSGSSQPSSV